MPGSRRPGGRVFAVTSLRRLEPRILLATIPTPAVISRVNVSNPFGITDDNSDESTPSITVDPQNSSHLASAWTRFDTDPTPALIGVDVSMSANGGASWTPLATPAPARPEQHHDAHPVQPDHRRQRGIRAGRELLPPVRPAQRRQLCRRGHPRPLQRRRRTFQRNHHLQLEPLGPEPVRGQGGPVAGPGGGQHGAEHQPPLRQCVRRLDRPDSGTVRGHELE